MFNQFQLVYPWVLWFLLLIPLLIFMKGRVGPDAALRYSALSLFGGLARPTRINAGSLFMALRYMALGCFIAALSRPQMVSTTYQVEDSGIDIMLAIDLSPSMEALDYIKNGQELSRVEVVQEAVRNFIQERPNDRIGMVVFAGEAFVLSPLTLDHDWLLQNVDRLKVGLAGDATAIGSALVVSANRLRTEKAKSKIIILLTDGANNSGRVTPIAAGRAAAAVGIKIYTIGAGSSHKAKFPYKDNYGNIHYTYIPVDMDEDALRTIAEIGNGKFFRAADTDSMANVYQVINKLEQSKIGSKKYDHVSEYFFYLVYPGLFLLGLEIALSHTRRFRKLP